MTRAATALAATRGAGDAEAWPPLPAPPPHNIEAEQSLLGAVLVNNEALYRVSDFLEPGHFFEPVHQQIYEIARDLIRTGKLASPITLKTFLPADVDIAGLTVARYLARLAAEATTIINARDYAEIVKDLFDRRQIIAIADDMRVAAETARPASEVAGIGIDCLDEIVASHATSHAAAVDMGQAAADAVENMTAAMHRSGAISGITTGHGCGYSRRQHGPCAPRRWAPAQSRWPGRNWSHRAAF
jgi:replicative DNA helicase